MSLLSYVKEVFGEELICQLLSEMQSSGVAVFSTEGNLLMANDGMRHFLDCDSDLSNPGNQIINPDLQRLSENNANGLIFEGILTISNLREVTYSLHAKIHRKENVLLVIAEADVMQMFEINKKLSVLNQEINNLQRSLLREKKMVQSRSSELEQKNETLKTLNEEKNKVIGIVAHDLRNPISTALSFASLLTSEYDKFPPENQVEFLKMIVERCQYSLHLLEDLLDVSKIEAGSIDLKLGNHDYIQFIRKNIKRNNNLTKQKSQIIRLETDLENINFSFDEGKMEQVLNNLISNASKYSSPGAEIVVKIGQENESVVTRVIDRGQGIAPEELDLLFQPFKVTSTKSTASEKSTGLGLAIVKKIIQAHDGRIEVESHPGQGSVFSFYLSSSTA